jgi:2-hydroxychromene-2-carboxylate isomerase
LSPPTRRLPPRLVQALTSPALRDARRAVSETRRRLGGAPHRVLYFHQVDDPYSQLAAQVLETLTDRYTIELLPFLVGPPSDAAAPERQRLEAFARKDAADVAPGYGLAFPRREAPPDAADVGRAAALLAGALSDGSFARLAADVGEALWSGDRGRLDALARAHAPADEATVHTALAEGDAQRRSLGHYLGATFHYGGEWYWGVDRLHHLERRLESLGARRPGAAPGPTVARPTPDIPIDRDAAPQVVEFFASLRSPYTYIAMERVFSLPRRLPVEVVLRPVLPMVMRGLPVPREKQRYILLDTRREAEDAGVPFGRVCDPVGRPVERCFSLFPWARERGRAGELLLAFARAAFAEGVDAGTDAGMRHVVEAAGLPWDDARLHLDRDSGWHEELEGNRSALLALGLWGVPSFRLVGRDGAPDFCTWGQDRLWRLEAEIRSRIAADPTSTRAGCR